MAQVKVQNEFSVLVGEKELLELTNDLVKVGADLDLNANRVVDEGVQVLGLNGTPVILVCLDRVEFSRHIEAKKCIYSSGVHQINGGDPVTENFSLNFSQNGQRQKVVLGASVSVSSLLFPGPGDYIVEIAQDDVGGRFLTWPTAVTAPGGKAIGLTNSSDANDVDVVKINYDGVVVRAVMDREFSE